MLIIDCNGLCYSAFYKTGNLTSGGVKTGIIYGFLRELFSIARRFRYHRPILFVWDGMRKSNIRRSIYPEYKANRGKSLLVDEDFAQFDVLRKEVLPEIGFKNIYRIDKYEADDIIAALCKLYTRQNKIIVSTDEDLYQLLDDTTAMYKPKKKELYTNKMFEEEYKIDPASWAQVKAIAGCRTDNVKGMAGVGEKTAIRILLWDIDKKVDEEMYERNMKLVCLPFERFRVKIPKRDEFSISGFRVVNYNYGFSSILKEMKQWVEIFC